MEMEIVDKKNMLVPKLRFKGFEGDLRKKALSSLSTKISDGLHSTPNYEENGEYYFVNGNNLINGKIYFNENTKRVNKEEYIKHKKDLSYRTILISINGTIGSLALFDDEKIILGKSACYVNVNIDTDKYFIYNYLQTPKVKNFFTSELTGSTIKNLSLTTIKSCEVSIPSLPEQQKIASFLSAVDEKIQQLNRKKELLAQYKKGLMQQLFSGKLRFKDEDGQEFPDWEERKLGDVLFEHKIKSTGKEEVFSVSVHKGLINQVEHLGRVFAAKNTENYNLVKPNDIIYTKSPTGNFPLGIIKQSKVNSNVIVSPLYGVFTPETAGLGYMLNVYFETPVNVNNYLSSIIQKGAKNTINITNTTFLSKKIKLPISKIEQQKIGDFLFNIDLKIENVSNLITQNQSFKKGLLQQMFV